MRGNGEELVQEVPAALVMDKVVGQEAEGLNRVGAAAAKLQIEFAECAAPADEPDVPFPLDDVDVALNLMVFWKIVPGEGGQARQAEAGQGANYIRRDPVPGRHDRGNEGAAKKPFQLGLAFLELCAEFIKVAAVPKFGGPLAQILALEVLVLPAVLQDRGVALTFQPARQGRSCLFRDHREGDIDIVGVGKAEQLLQLRCRLDRIIIAPPEPDLAAAFGKPIKVSGQGGLEAIKITGGRGSSHKVSKVVSRRIGGEQKIADGRKNRILRLKGIEFGLPRFVFARGYPAGLKGIDGKA